MHHISSEQPKQKVLIVDDAVFVHQIFRVAFRRVGNFEVYEAANGLEALQQLDRVGPVDLIVLDLNMPVMNGLQFLAELRRRVRDWRAHILVASTEDREGLIREALIHGAHSFIQKPFTLDQFLQLLERIRPMLPAPA